MRLKIMMMPSSAGMLHQCNSADERQGLNSLPGWEEKEWRSMVVQNDPEAIIQF